MNIYLTSYDIVFAATLAFFLTWLIVNLSKFMGFVSAKSKVFAYQREEINKIMQKCYGLFPREIVQFNGKTFRRGMNVRLVTNRHKVIEGKLIGLNNDNMLCLLTNKYIVAHELESIEEMNLIE